MPGSTTLGHTHALVMLSHTDAERLATVLQSMARMLDMPGPNRLSDAQVAVLCEGRVGHRGELTAWTRAVAEHLRAHL
ncbi:hypothetical protein LRS74_11440 [Streptomyces sp. LX-29]|uniref:hypothetical protein n=1 Tax=Streptomyces sp. LX-29 TaxID=2900152 RepID=UPI00240E95D3|nr:hypothetical protein [Streptomyces sp. LX-29]WFB07598.1 hypothetical protein LRS74_11440 [Streptomyces sp. LX-29]